MTTPESSPLIFGTPPPGVTCRDRPAAYAVISNQEQHVAAVSLTIDGRDYFLLPGGGTDEGETPHETITREVREELARHVVVERPLGSAVQYFFAAIDNCWYKMTAHFFTAHFDGQAEGQGEFDLHWIDPARHQDDFFHPCQVWAVSQAENIGLIE